MSLVRRLARPMVAGIFISGGIDTLRNPGPRVEMAGPLASRIVDALPVSLPTDPATLVRVDAGVKIGAGALFALGRLPRLSALALAGSLVPTTIAGHPFWRESDSAARAGQKVHFLKNVSMIGAMLLAAVDTEGKPSVAWRTRHAADEAGKGARKQTGKARKKAEKARATTEKAAKKAGKKLPG